MNNPRSKGCRGVTVATVRIRVKVSGIMKRERTKRVELTISAIAALDGMVGQNTPRMRWGKWAEFPTETLSIPLPDTINIPAPDHRPSSHDCTLASFSVSPVASGYSLAKGISSYL